MTPGLASLQSRSRSTSLCIVSSSISMLTILSKIAEHVEAAAPDDRVIVVDAFAGAGGNTIAFAKSGRWKRVYGIEKDSAVLACAKHNAKIYGVADRITWFLGDCFELLKNQLKDLGPYSVVFASPPWGGWFSNTLIPLPF